MTKAYSRSPIPFAEDAGGFGFVFEFEVGFFEGHVDGEAGCEATVGVEAEADGVDVLDGLFDAGDDLVGGVDLLVAAFDGAEADELAFGEFLPVESGCPVGLS